jgi:acyl carrier protein
MLQFFYNLLSSPALLIAIVVVASLAIGTMRHWLTAARLRDRQQFADEDFGKAFFAGDARESAAIRTRRVLAENLETDLGGIRPDDRLDDDLNAQISANVDLFWQLEKEFRIDCQVEDLEVFEKTTSQLVTFSDLVSYVQKKIEEQPSARDENYATVSGDPRLDWLDVIGYSWFTGIAMCVASSMFDVGWLMTVGLTVAFLPIIIGIAFEAFQVLSEVAKNIQANGFGVLLREPLSLVIWLAVLIPFLLIGIWFSWVLFNLYFGGE